MKRLTIWLIAGLLMTAGLTMIITGCSAHTSPTTPSSTGPGATSSAAAATPVSTTPAVSPVNPTGIETTADPIMHNILVSLNKDDYTGFSRDFSAKVKNALNQTAFDQLYTQTQTALGDFQSVLFVSSTVQNGVEIIIYVAHFAKEPAGLVATLGLQKTGSSYQVQGLNFDSPNLRGQPLDVPKVRAMADPETENVLVSLNNDDYTGFARDFDAVAKNAIPELVFNNIYKLGKSTVGDYRLSKTFESASSQNGIVTVRYLAQYSSEPAGVWVTIAFDSHDKIAGLLFNSPKLSAAQTKP